MSRTSLAPRPLALAGALCLLAASAGAAQLNIAVSANVATLDPHQSATVQTDLSVISHLYLPLVIRGPDLKLQPAAAESWQPVNDTTWRFKLRPGITFANGEKLDAAAVKWNVERVLDPKTRARIKAWFDPIKEVRVLSETELEMVTAEPFPALADQMSMFFLLPPKWSETNNPTNRAMGSGPYLLKEFVSGDRIVLEANPGYVGAKPAFDSVVIRPIPEASSRVAAVLAGEIDLAFDIPPSDFKRINDSKRATAASVESVRAMFVKINTLKAPFKDNRELRQALNHAVDKQAIIDAVLGGLTKEARCQVLNDIYFGYNPELKPYPYDPKKAKELLAKAGVRPGTQVELEVPLGRYLLSQEIGQAVAAQLEEIGLKVKITEMEFGSWLTKYVRAGNLGELAYMGQAWPTLDADGLLTLFEPGNNYAYWDDKEFGAALAKARATTDQARRKALYKQATEVMCREAPVIFMFSQPLTYAASSRVVWAQRGDDWVRAYDVRPR